MWSLVLTPPLMCSATLGKLVGLSKPQCPHLHNGYYHTHLLGSRHALSASQFEYPASSGLSVVFWRPLGSYLLLAPSCSGDQIVGATIYFDNLQSGEVTQLLNTMGHHTVGLKLHRKGDRSPEPGQTWAHEVFGSRISEVVLVSAHSGASASHLPVHPGLTS